MERRFFSFILASTAFFLVYASLRIMFVPPPPPPAAAELAELDEAEADPIADAGEEADPIDKEVDQKADEAPPVQRPESPQWRTLGSMDPASGYVMLVTLNSRGAGIERIELTERKNNGRFKYRRVDVRSGYLGYFAADPTATDLGVKVNVVGPGTPAAEAACLDTKVQGGLQTGDLIVAVDGAEISHIGMLEKVLSKTKPDQDITIDIVRPTLTDASASADGNTEDEDAEAEDDDQPAIGPAGKTLQFVAKLTEHPLDLVRLAHRGGDDQIAGNLSRLSCLLTVGKVGRKEILESEQSIKNLNDPGELVWNLVDQADIDPADGAEKIAFSVQLSEKEMKAVGGHAVGLQRSYALQPGSYVIHMDVQIDNKAEESQQLAYRLEGVNGVTLEGWWYSNKISPNWGGSAARDIIYKTAAEGHELVSGYGLLKRIRDEDETDAMSLFAPDSEAAARNLNYIGVDAQYFTAAYMPAEGENSFTTFRRAAATLAVDESVIPKGQERAVNATFFLDSGVAEVPAGSSLKQRLRLFAGPKQPDLVEGYGLGDCIYYGWFWWVAKPLGHLLHLLSGVGNYAVAIVLLTLIVRGFMFPFSRKAAVNAQRMQELAPELKKIAEKYKDDMEGRVRAQRELQQRVGFNPLAGCAPMFLQLPIFIGLYRTLSVDIELRQAAFASWTTWASNLAAPDMLYYWGDWLWEYLSGRGVGWLGPYFNILPMIVVALFLAQQKMFMPPPTDEQTAMTQKMMNYMTLVMGLFFFRVPAGLCIYFITSSLWGIGERILVKKTLPKTPHFNKDVLEGKVNQGGQSSDGKPSGGKLGGGPSPNGDQGGGDTWSDRIRQRIAPVEPEAPKPRDRKRPPAGGKKRK